MNDASKARDIWDYLLTRICWTSWNNGVEPPRLERAIETYTSFELENIVLRWASAQLGWESASDRPICERVISTPESSCIHLVEGGRWLLVVDLYTASISYFDLDSSVVTGRTLTPPALKESSVKASVHIRLKMDYTSRTLSFNLALSALRAPFHTWEYPSESHVSIWHVHLLVDDSGQGVALNAEYLASFSYRPEIEYQHAIYLDNSYIMVAATFRWDSVMEHCIVIIRWPAANGRGSDYPMYIIPRTWMAVRASFTLCSYHF